MKNDSGRLNHRSLTEMTIVTPAILYNYCYCHLLCLGIFL